MELNITGPNHQSESSPPCGLAMSNRCAGNGTCKLFSSSIRDAIGMHVMGISINKGVYLPRIRLTPTSRPSKRTLLGTAVHAALPIWFKARPSKPFEVYTPKQQAVTIKSSRMVWDFFIDASFRAPNDALTSRLAR